MKNITTRLLTVSTICFLMILLLLLINTSTVFGTQIDVDWLQQVNVQYSNSKTFTTTKFDLALVGEDILTYGYCLEPYSTIEKKKYNFNIVSIDSIINKGDSYYKAAWVLDTFSPELNNKEDSYKSAAVQSIIWYLTTSDTFTISKYSKVKVYFDNYMQALSKVTFTPELKNYLNNTIFIAQNSTCQDLLFEIPNNPVPEPATLLLFGSGIILISNFRKKNKTFLYK